VAPCVLGEQKKKKLETGQLSNNTVKPRILDLSAGIEEQLASRLKFSFVVRCKLTNQQTCQG